MQKQTFCIAKITFFFKKRDYIAYDTKILEMQTIKDIMGCMAKKRYNITTHARREMSPKGDDINEWIDYMYRRRV